MTSKPYLRSSYLTINPGPHRPCAHAAVAMHLLNFDRFGDSYAAPEFYAKYKGFHRPRGDIVNR